MNLLSTNHMPVSRLTIFEVDGIVRALLSSDLHSTILPAHRLPIGWYLPGYGSGAARSRFDSLFWSFPLKKIYVGNLPYQTTEQDLEALFAEFGQVSSVALIVDRHTGRSRGFGFVEMESESEAASAIEGLNQREMDGRNLVVNEARERTPRDR